MLLTKFTYELPPETRFVGRVNEASNLVEHDYVFILLQRLKESFQYEKNRRI
jgi:hypothetical protein